MQLHLYVKNLGDNKIKYLICKYILLQLYSNVCFYIEDMIIPN